MFIFLDSISQNLNSKTMVGCGYVFAPIPQNPSFEEKGERISKHPSVFYAHKIFIFKKKK